MPKRILLIAATTGYQIRVFESAARALGHEVILATDRCDHLDDPWGDNAIAVRFEKPEEAVQALASIDPRPEAIVAVGDRPTQIAALAAAALDLPFHSPDAVLAARNKYLARERFRRARLPVPDYFRLSSEIQLEVAVRSARFPCVIKPIGLSASRGVIRADNESEFCNAVTRIRALLQSPDIRRMREEQNEFLQVETYIPGMEYAIEGIVTGGELQVLAIFDKPDPLEGPFFEETIYVSPSRASAAVQNALIHAARKGVRALGLTHGPVHAEMRHNDSGVWLLEIAARPIGGLCAAALRFTGGMRLEELILRHALGEDISTIAREEAASGVMMIPIPNSGVYRGVSGIEEAREVNGVTDVIITAKPGQRMLKLPEGASYLGFIFAGGSSPEDAEAALRDAHNCLRFDIAAELPVMPSRSV